VIRGFELLRADGRVIDESLTSDRMKELGWAPSKVVEVRWRWAARRLKLSNHSGLEAMVIPDRQQLAVLWHHDAAETPATLYVVPGDNHRPTRIPDEAFIDDELESVIYSRIIPETRGLGHVFSCTCLRRRDLAVYSVYVDALSGLVTSIHSR